jgi:DNA-binding transcriptional MocR family regulator
VRGGPVAGARLGFASLTEEELERAVRALAAAAKSVR